MYNWGSVGKNGGVGKNGDLAFTLTLPLTLP